MLKKMNEFDTSQSTYNVNLLFITLNIKTLNSNQLIKSTNNYLVVFDIGTTTLKIKIFDSNIKIYKSDFVYVFSNIQNFEFILDIRVFGKRQ